MTIITSGPQPQLPPAPCFGYCQHCGTEHSLGQGESRQYALALMAELEERGGIDLEAATKETSPLYSLDYLFGPARGQMFGVLECRAPDGSLTVLRAFSGQYNGQWLVDGWVPPLFDITEWQQTNRMEAQIKDLNRHLELLAPEDSQRPKLLQERRALSQQLMKDLHAVYSLNNFRGECRGLPDVFLGGGGLPTGTGDCCAPKLLNYAAQQQLTPFGLSEFYLGRANRSQTRQHGTFYPSCAGKCQPILGFLLCGLANGDDVAS